MGNMKKTFTGNTRVVLILLLIVIIGISCTLLVAYSTDKNMRDDLLLHARIAAYSIGLDHVSAMTGSENDLHMASYQRVKSQLTLMRTADSHCRFLYLMGQRTDGVVFFYTDSLSADSEDYAPPGLVYDEVSGSYLHSFSSRKEAVVGPITDRWGTLVTALVPLVDPQTEELVAVLGMDIDSSHWKKEIMARCAVPFAGTLFCVFLVMLLDSKGKSIAARRESEERHRLFFENCPIGIIHYDIHGKIFDVNEPVIATFGSSREKLIGLDIHEIPDSKFKAEICKSLSGKAGYYEGDYASYSGGKTAAIKAHWLPIFSKGKIISGIGIVDDITDLKLVEKERQKLESQLQQNRKMEAIGTLAGGIAHDFNNILGAIIGYTEMARDDSPAKSSVVRDLDKVLEASDRAADLVKQILAFSRQDKTECILLQPASMVNKAVTMLRPIIPTTIQVTQNIDPATSLILANPTQVQQILMNLCSNAFHAMEETGGRLDISLKETYLSREDLTHEPRVKAGTFIQISVCDSGSGMTSEVKAKIFNPYFTTKKTGKGTGMGLSIVHGIVKDYGGFITFYSEPDEGSAFHIFLPVVNNEVLSGRNTVDLIPTGKEEILLVDDEELLADMGKDILERLGYRVTLRKSSMEALETFRNQPVFF